MSLLSPRVVLEEEEASTPTSMSDRYWSEQVWLLSSCPYFLPIREEAGFLDCGKVEVTGPCFHRREVSWFRATALGHTEF